MTKQSVKISLGVLNHQIPFQGNIVGGEFTEVNEFPWAALLNLSSSENGRTNRCGGSLITDRFPMLNPMPQSNKKDLFRHIVTAAHCLQKNNLDGAVEFEYDDITIILGIYLLNILRLS